MIYIISKYFMALIITMCCLSVHAETIGDAYVFGFDAERITGIPEAQMEEYGCLYKIDKSKFISLLMTTTDKNKYQNLNIGAKVIFSDDIYFIDRDGIIRNGFKYFSINTKNFMLLLMGKCPRTNR